MYGSWGSTAVQRGDDWAKTNRYTNRQTGTTTRTIRTDEGSAVTRRGAGGGAVGVGEGGNVYAGKDGNVYRREDGTWQKYDNGGWSNTDRQPSDKPRPTDRSTTTRQEPTVDRSTTDRSTIDQLNRDSSGAQRGQPADWRLRELPRRQWHARHRQLPRGWWHARWRWRRTKALARVAEVRQRRREGT